MKNLIRTTAVVALVFQMTSCKKDFEEINTNPNGLTDAPYTNILSGSITSLSRTVDNSLSYSYASAWAQQIARTLYQEHDIYQPRDPSTAWRNMYLAAFNLQKLIDQAEATPNRKGVAMVLKAYAMQTVTDLWGMFLILMHSKVTKVILHRSMMDNMLFISTS